MVFVRAALICVMGIFLTACEARPAQPPVRIDEVTFLSAGGPVTDALVLMPDHSYTVRRIAPAPANRNEVRSGNWRTILAEQQLVLLDSQTAIRLIHSPAAADSWRFVPVTLVASAALPAGQRESYTYLFDRWYVLRADMARATDEDAAPAALLPAANRR